MGRKDGTEPGRRAAPYALEASDPASSTPLENGCSCRVGFTHSRLHAAFTVGVRVVMMGLLETPGTAPSSSCWAQSGTPLGKAPLPGLHRRVRGSLADTRSRGPDGTGSDWGCSCLALGRAPALASAPVETQRLPVVSGLGQRRAAFGGQRSARVLANHAASQGHPHTSVPDSRLPVAALPVLGLNLSAGTI